MKALFNRIADVWGQRRVMRAIYADMSLTQEFAKAYWGARTAGLMREMACGTAENQIDREAEDIRAESMQRPYFYAAMGVVYQRLKAQEAAQGAKPDMRSVLRNMQADYTARTAYWESKLQPE